MNNADKVWTRPDYAPIARTESWAWFRCSGCGSIVDNMRVHDAWHRRVECGD